MSNGSGLGGLWLLIKIVIVIFAVTACYTADLVKNDPDQAIVAVLIWVVVIVGLIVGFMALSYIGGKSPHPASNYPGYGQSSFGQQPYQQYFPANRAYAMYTPPVAAIRPCRYCDSYLAPTSPICPRCGRKN